MTSSSTTAATVVKLVTFTTSVHGRILFNPELPFQSSNHFNDITLIIGMAVGLIGGNNFQFEFRYSHVFLGVMGFENVYFYILLGITTQHYRQLLFEIRIKLLNSK